MTGFFSKYREKGIPLRTANLVMAGLVVLLAAMLMVATYRSSSGFEKLRQTTDQHVKLRQSSYELQIASDYLTEQARCFTESGNREYLDNYFREANETRRRDRALEVLQNEMGNIEPYQALQKAMAQSIHLMDTEYYAMRLTLESSNTDLADYPEQIRNVELSEKDRNLSDPEQESLARDMVFDDNYHHQKVIISENTQACLQELDDIMNAREEDADELMGRALRMQNLLIVLLILCVLFIIFMNNRLMIHPLMDAVKEVHNNNTLTVQGSSEFRYLAETYNRVYGSNQKHTERLAYEAYHDKLTGLSNRSSFDLVMEKVKDQEIALMLIDVDHFKRVNDTRGHDVGDQALCKVADVLLRCFRDDDFVFRIGGDEFAVIMVKVNPTHQEMISQKVAGINQRLAAVNDERLQTSVSAGVTFADGEGNPDLMFQKADKALYHVKSHGRKSCGFYRRKM